MTTAAHATTAKQDTLGITEESGEDQPTPTIPAPAAPAEKKAEESKVKTIQLSFDKNNAEEMKLYDKIVKDANDDDRKPPVYLMRYLKKHYGKGE